MPRKNSVGEAMHQSRGHSHATPDGLGKAMGQKAMRGGPAGCTSLGNRMHQEGMPDSRRKNVK